MQFTTRKSGNVLIIDLAGRLTSDDGAKTLFTQTKKLIDAGNRNLILNMAGLQAIDSSGLGELEKIHKALGSQVKLLNAGTAERKAIAETNLSQNYQFFSSEATAVNSFG